VLVSLFSRPPTPFLPSDASAPLCIPHRSRRNGETLPLPSSRLRRSLPRPPADQRNRAVVKGLVEIISGCDRRLQGESEETGTPLQRDRSGVSEMEPLPAAQDALRHELKPSPPPSAPLRSLELLGCRRLASHRLVFVFLLYSFFAPEARDDGRSLGWLLPVVVVLVLVFIRFMFAPLVRSCDAGKP